MLIVVSYDVQTQDAAGAKRLRRVAKKCQDYGIRVQNSVFECSLDWAQWIKLRAELEAICDLECDSLRYYNLGNNYEGKAIHVGAKPTFDVSKDTLLL